MFQYVVLGLAALGLYFVTSKGEVRKLKSIERVSSSGRAEGLYFSGVSVSATDMRRVFGVGDKPSNPVSAEDRSWLFKVSFDGTNETELVAVDYTSDDAPGRLSVSTKGGSRELGKAFASALRARASR